MQYRKHLWALLIGLASFFSVQAQTKYAVINTKYILDKIPEYKEADKKLKALGDQWQKEIDDKQMVYLANPLVLCLFGRILS